MIAGTLNIGGVEYVVVPRSEYEERLPRLPAKDHRGERPAKAAIQAVIARSLIRRRTEAGLEQKELAARAGVRAETISRIESGRYRPQVATMQRLERALGKVDEDFMAHRDQPAQAERRKPLDSRKRRRHANSAG